jgi:diguanylate cyclase (GGDEF)-like protein
VNLHSLARSAGPGADEQLLISVARLLWRNTRAADLVGRSAPDEFMIIAPDTDREGAQALTQRIVNQIQATVGPSIGNRPGVIACAGVAVASSPQLSDNLKLLSRAEAALAQARSENTPRVVID